MFSHAEASSLSLSVTLTRFSHFIQHATPLGCKIISFSQSCLLACSSAPRDFSHIATQIMTWRTALTDPVETGTLS